MNETEAKEEQPEVQSAALEDATRSCSGSSEQIHDHGFRTKQLHAVWKERDETIRQLQAELQAFREDKQLHQAELRKAKKMLEVERNLRISERAEYEDTLRKAEAAVRDLEDRMRVRGTVVTAESQTELTGTLGAEGRFVCIEDRPIQRREENDDVTAIRTQRLGDSAGSEAAVQHKTYAGEHSAGENRAGNERSEDACAPAVLSQSIGMDEGPRSLATIEKRNTMTQGREVNDRSDSGTDEKPVEGEDRKDGEEKDQVGLPTSNAPGPLAPSVTLGSEILHFSLTLGSIANQRRAELLWLTDLVKECAHKLWPRARVELYGSLATVRTERITLDLVPSHPS